MADFLTKLAGRTLGWMPIAKPIIASRFAQTTALAGRGLLDEHATLLDRPWSEPTQEEAPFAASARSERAAPDGASKVVDSNTTSDQWSEMSVLSPPVDPFSAPAEEQLSAAPFAESIGPDAHQQTIQRSPSPATTMASASEGERAWHSERATAAGALRELEERSPSRERALEASTDSMIPEVRLASESPIQRAVEHHLDQPIRSASRPSQVAKSAIDGAMPPLMINASSQMSGEASEWAASQRVSSEGALRRVTTQQEAVVESLSNKPPIQRAVAQAPVQPIRSASPPSQVAKSAMAESAMPPLMINASSQMSREASERAASQPVSSEGALRRVTTQQEAVVEPLSHNKPPIQRAVAQAPVQPIRSVSPPSQVARSAIDGAMPPLMIKTSSQMSGEASEWAASQRVSSEGALAPVGTGQEALLEPLSEQHPIQRAVGPALGQPNAPLGRERSVAAKEPASSVSLVPPVEGHKRPLADYSSSHLEASAAPSSELDPFERQQEGDLSTLGQPKRSSRESQQALIEEDKYTTKAPRLLASPSDRRPSERLASALEGAAAQATAANASSVAKGMKHARVPSTWRPEATHRSEQEGAAFFGQQQADNDRMSAQPVSQASKSASIVPDSNGAVQRRELAGPPISKRVPPKRSEASALATGSRQWPVTDTDEVTRRATPALGALSQEASGHAEARPSMAPPPRRALASLQRTRGGQAEWDAGKESRPLVRREEKVEGARSAVADSVAPSRQASSEEAADAFKANPFGRPLVAEWSSEEPDSRRALIDSSRERMPAQAREATPTIRVAIGRIEVRAAPPPKAPVRRRRRRTRSRPTSSLDNYLKQRGGRR